MFVAIKIEYAIDQRIAIRFRDAERWRSAARALFARPQQPLVRLSSEPIAPRVGITVLVQNRQDRRTTVGFGDKVDGVGKAVKQSPANWWLDERELQRMPGDAFDDGVHLGDEAHPKPHPV